MVSAEREPITGAPPGASILWGMTHVASLKFQGGELLEILYNVMQRPVGHDQRAYSTNMLR